MRTLPQPRVDDADVPSRWAKQLDAFAAVATALSSALDLDEVLQRAVGSLLEVTGLSSGVIYFVDEDHQRLVGRNAIGFRYGLRPGIDVHELSDKESFVGRAFRTERPIIFDVSNPELGYSSITAPEIRCIVPERVQTAVAARIVSASQLYGVVVLCSHGVHRGFSSEDLEFVQLVASQIGVATERARLYESLKSQAIESRTLYEIGRLLGSRLDQEAILRRALDLACLNLGFARCELELRDRTSLQLVASRPGDGPRGAQSASAVAPLTAGDMELGALRVSGPPSAVSRRAVEAIADLLAMAVWNWRLFDESKRLGVSEERNRLARDIHDGLAQRFYGIDVQLEAAELELAKGGDPIQFLARARKETRHGLEEARRSIWDLRSNEWDGERVVAAIRRVAADFRRRSGLKCQVRARGREEALRLPLQVAVLRGVQELLRNVEKHARAEAVRVTVSFRPTRLTVTVVDDGVGNVRNWDQQDPSAGGFGLVGIRESMASVRGALILRGREGGGTLASLVAEF